MFRSSPRSLGWHYIHPATGKPLKQPRRIGDCRYINNEVPLINGQWGLITKDFGPVTMMQLEEARLLILQRIPNNYGLVMHTDYPEYPIGFKPQEGRMGKGKTAIHHYIFKFTTGIPLFELTSASKYRLSRHEAEIVFLKARAALPIETVVVPQGRVDEYS
eukprot:PhF_6_TR17602/c0_g1_i1/m.26753/K02878/RP-L16, MRPL16, rplP; large subunit ribosomal protein L16